MKLLTKILYKPLGLLFGLMAGLVARQAFRAAWGSVDAEEPPTPTTELTTWRKVIGAAALQAMIFSVTRAVADRLGAQTFRHLFGAWPGEREPEPAKD